ncbi:histone acetyltransferase type B catalytic subunit [Sarocladium implicatum]|nr:histone acetyltransferase type B catalytic subunit [Sarocladium implicatum]
MASGSDIEDWQADANDALVVKLLAPGASGLQHVASFHPNFTYSIFGDEEKIIGYKNPKIELRYRANDMRPNLKITHGAKLNTIGEIGPTDIRGILEEGNHLPKVAFATAKDFEDSSLQLQNNWTPPGQLHSSIETSDGTSEIWMGRLDNPAIKQMITRVQILVPLFIEGGSYIGQKPDSDPPEQDFSDADRWTVFFLYRKKPVSDTPGKYAYTFMGFSTVYRFYFFQPPTPPASPKEGWELPQGDMDLSELPCRTRLSQFIILPPFQHKGHGPFLYNTIYQHYLKHSQTHDFTIENPNEAFDDLRDACDFAFLRKMPEFAALHLDTKVNLPKSGSIPQLIVGGDAIESIRQKTKIAPRQFNRVLEMHVLSQLPDAVQPKLPTGDEEAAASLDFQQADLTKDEQHIQSLWHLVLKQRLYRHNKDILSQLDLSERRTKLEETVISVELEYARLLALCERSARHTQDATSASNGKRKMDQEAGESTSKRARTEEA